MPVSTRRYDEKCPHCLSELGSIHNYFVNNDYMTDFVFDCPRCEKPIQCDVEMRPDFILSVPETKEEYASRIRRYRCP